MYKISPKVVVVAALLVALVAPAMGEGRSLLGKPIKMKASCKNGRKGCFFKVPVAASSCSVAFGGLFPLATCLTAPGVPVFGSPFLIDLPDIVRTVTCTVVPAGGQVPRLVCPGSGVPLPQGPGLSEPFVFGNKFIPPFNAGTCTASRSSATGPATVNCTPAAPGSPTFPPGTVLDIPIGRCTFGARANDEPLIACVPIPVQASPPSLPASPTPSLPTSPTPSLPSVPTLPSVPSLPIEPIVVGGKITPPPGSNKCVATRLVPGGPISVDCTSGTPSFPPGTILEFPRSVVGRCMYTAGPQGLPSVQCVNRPPPASPVTTPPASPVTTPPASPDTTPPASPVTTPPASPPGSPGPSPKVKFPKFPYGHQPSSG